MYQWIREYNNKGLEGLKAKKPEGRGSGKGNLDGKRPKRLHKQGLLIG